MGSASLSRALVGSLYIKINIPTYSRSSPLTENHAENAASAPGGRCSVLGGVWALGQCDLDLPLQMARAARAFFCVFLRL